MDVRRSQSGLPTRAETGWRSEKAIKMAHAEDDLIGSGAISTTRAEAIALEASKSAKPSLAYMFIQEHIVIHK